MFNKVILQGNLTKDIELTFTQNGMAIGKSSIAVNRKYKSKEGENKEEVLFIELTFFGRNAEIANQYLHKGSKVLVSGRLDFQQWTSDDGTKRNKHAIIVETMVMLDKKTDENKKEEKIPTNLPKPTKEYQEDEIPF